MLFIQFTVIDLVYNLVLSDLSFSERKHKKVFQQMLTKNALTFSYFRIPDKDIHLT